MERGEIGVGLVGYKFMGRAHSNAYRQVANFFDVDPAPRMAAICGRDEAGVREAADTLGWESYETDYRTLMARDDIGLVDIATPGNTHREIVLAALEAGKHVLCEKPLANTLPEAREMLAAARDAGTVNMVCFNYRRAPAVQLAKKLVEEGRLGEIRHWRAKYLQDFIMDSSFPLIWRLQKEVSGSGALGDIGAHIIDLAHFVVVARPGFSIDALRQRVPALATRMIEPVDLAVSSPPRIILVQAETPDVSSTAIRGRVAGRCSLMGLVPPAVSAYISQHDLYSSGH